MWSRQSFQIVVQDMNVGNRVGASGVLDDQIIDSNIFALLETDSEVRLGQGAEVVADFGVFPRHVDNHRAVGQLPEEFMLVRLQHTHEAEILGRDFTVEVALKDGVRHLVAEDDEAATAGAKQSLHAAFNILMDDLVVLVKDDQYRGNPLEIGHFGCCLLGEKLLESTL